MYGIGSLLLFARVLIRSFTDLGEVTRNVVLHLVDAQVIFKGFSSKNLNAHYGLDTASALTSDCASVLAPSLTLLFHVVMSALEASSVANHPAAENPLAAIRHAITEDLSIDDSLVSDADCIAVARVSEIVGTRGCRLSACALAATIKQTGIDKSDKRVRFGLDGSLVEFYPRFEERVRAALRELVGEEVESRVSIDLAKDGSGVGAALCAAAAKEMENKKTASSS